jgi:von Willebrand factor type A domain
MTHPPTDATSLRLVSSDPESRPRARRSPSVEDGLPAKAGLKSIVPSWGLSLLLHAGLFVLLALSLPGLRGGIVGDPDGDLRSIGIWVGHSGDGTDGDGGGSGPAKAPSETKLVTTAPSTPPPPVAPTPAPATAIQTPLKNPVLDTSAPLVRTAERALPVTEPASASPIIGPSDRPERAGLFQPHAEPPTGAGAARGLGSTGGGGRRGSRGTTPFFGIIDVGSRFVYVIDCSGSMYSHNAMGAAKNELLRSLHTLNRYQQFQIVFYNTDQKWLKAPGKIDFRFFAADEKSLRLAGDFISEVEAGGGTVHLAAIQLGLRLHPDVLFFLTDGGKPGLSDFDRDEIKRLNDRRTRIHCVQFSSADDPDAAAATDFLRKLAAQNDGEYVCRDVTRFDAPSAVPKTARATGEER